MKQQKTNSVNNSINNPLTRNNIVEVTESIWRFTSLSKSKFTSSASKALETEERH